MSMDSSMHYVRKRKYFTMGDLLNAMTTPPTGTQTVGEVIQSAAGTVGDSPEVFIDEVGSTIGAGTFGFSGYGFSANLADKIAALLRIPCDLDPFKPVGFRIHWTGSAAASSGRGVTWTPTFNAVAKGAVLVTIASITTALDTVITNSLNTLANGNEWSPRGIKNNCFSLTREQVESGAVLQIALDATLNSSPGTIHLYGIEMDYAVQLCEGPGSLVDQPLRANSTAAL